MADVMIAGAPGRRPVGWLITDGKVGMDVQVRGVADAMGLDAEFRHVILEGVWARVSPYCPVPPSHRFAQPNSQFAPPWPDVAIATGRASIPFIRAIGRHAGRQTFRVVLQDPKTGPGVAEAIWVPEHDTRTGSNVIKTLTAPHSFTPRRLTELRAAVPTEIAALPGPRVTVSVGGPNAVYPFTVEDGVALGAGLARIAPHVGSFMITASRRTPPAVLAAVKSAVADTPHLIWGGEGANPYPDFLAHADRLVVTGDSVNMTGEACATGRPVYVFEPAGGSPKFRRFHEALRGRGATRPLPTRDGPLDDWSYEPIDSAAEIAAKLCECWQAFNGGGRRAT